MSAIYVDAMYVGIGAAFFLVAWRLIHALGHLDGGSSI